MRMFILLSPRVCVYLWEESLIIRIFNAYRKDLVRPVIPTGRARVMSP